MTMQWRPTCDFYFEDHFRGRDVQECRLLARNPIRQAWEIGLCRTCPVPAIIRANACEHMRLRASVTRPLAAGFQRRVRVTAYCEWMQRTGFDPHIGFGECHPLPLAFKVKK